MLLIGSIVLVNFLINLKAMFLLRSAFVENTDWTLDFQRITQWMLAKVLAPRDWNNPQLTNIDFFKLTSFYVSQNNQLVLGLSLLEIIVVNTLKPLRRISILRKTVTTVCGMILIATLIVTRLSESFGSF